MVATKAGSYSYAAASTVIGEEIRKADFFLGFDSNNSLSLGLIVLGSRIVTA
jgi:hypothetical protein